MKTKVTQLERVAVEELLANLEGSTSTDSMGVVWGSVYLDNCPMSATKSWSGVLSSLKKKGIYSSQGDGIFGEIRVAIELE